MANENVEWVEVPWRQPSAASVTAILDRLGLDRRHIDPKVLEDLSEDDNQVLSGAGVFGDPVSRTVGADYSLFSGVVGDGSGDSITYRAFRNGKKIGEREGDGLFDTVAFWNEVA